MKKPIEGTGRSAGIFSNINDNRFSEAEKEEAVRIVLNSYDFGGVRRKAMMEVIIWLWNKYEVLRGEKGND